MLIDFDLMDKVNTRYPDGFNNRIYERHPDAVPGKPRKVIHDRHGLIRVMELEDFYNKLSTELRTQMQRYKTSEIPLSNIFTT